MDRLLAYGVDVTTKQLVTIIMANVEHAAREPYGNKLKSSLQTLRRAYAYNHAHTDTSLQAIMAELATADAVRHLADAPAPAASSHGTANSVGDATTSYVRRLFDEDSSYDDCGTAAAASYASDSDESTEPKTNCQ